MRWANRLRGFSACSIIVEQLSESTLASFDGYKSHVEGLIRLLTIRWPGRYRYDSSLAGSVGRDAPKNGKLHLLIMVKIRSKVDSSF